MKDTLYSYATGYTEHSPETIAVKIQIALQNAFVFAEIPTTALKRDSPTVTRTVQDVRVCQEEAEDEPGKSDYWIQVQVLEGWRTPLLVYCETPEQEAWPDTLDV